MLFRAQEYQEPCGLCDQTASSACQRCARLLCPEHTPSGPRRRCARCESEYAIVIQQAQKPPVRAATWVGGGLLCVATGTLLFVITGTWIGAAFCGAAPVIAYLGLGNLLREKRALQAGEEEILRARFLSGKTPARLSAPATKQLSD